MTSSIHTECFFSVSFKALSRLAFSSLSCSNSSTSQSHQIELLEYFGHELTFSCLSALILSSCPFACAPAFFASSTLLLSVACSLLAISTTACFSLICAVQGWSACCLALI